MSDLEILERLLVWSTAFDVQGIYPDLVSDLRKAADEIKRLRTAVALLIPDD